MNVPWKVCSSWKVTSFVLSPTPALLKTASCCGTQAGLERPFLLPLFSGYQIKWWLSRWLQMFVNHLHPSAFGRTEVSLPLIDGHEWHRCAFWTDVSFPGRGAGRGWASISLSWKHSTALVKEGVMRLSVGWVLPSRGLAFGLGWTAPTVDSRQQTKQLFFLSCFSLVQASCLYQLAKQADDGMWQWLTSCHRWLDYHSLYHELRRQGAPCSGTFNSHWRDSGQLEYGKCGSRPSPGFPLPC